jgi:hypothetical protein
MLRISFAVPISIVLLLGATRSAAQGPSLVGTWQRFQVTNDSGTIQPQAPKPFLILSADGFYSQTGFPENEVTTAKKAFAQLSEQEMRDRFGRGVARFGRYVLSGATLTRTDMFSLDPSVSGRAAVQEVKMEGDVMILLTPRTKGESRWRRAK